MRIRKIKISIKFGLRGGHSDVGGSYLESGLSDVALGWMLDNAQDCGLNLKSNYEEGIKGNPLGELHNSREGLWRVWSKVVRNIPENSYIHKSVLDRMRLNLDYKPINLPDEYEVVSNFSYDKLKF